MRSLNTENNIERTVYTSSLIQSPTLIHLYYNTKTCPFSLVIQINERLFQIYVKRATKALNIFNALQQEKSPEKIEHHRTWYVLIARVCSLVLRCNVNADTAGRIGTLISRVLVAERSGARAARGREYRWHRGRFRGKIVVLLVAGQQVRIPSLVIGHRCLVPGLVLDGVRLLAAWIILIGVQAAELIMRLLLGR